MSTQTRTLTIQLPKPHPGQRRAIRDAKRWNVLACGRRFGKSVLLTDRVIEPALAGFPVAWFSPTYKMLGEIWREVRHTLTPLSTAVSVQDHRIEIITGGVIDMWSLDAYDSARGRKYKRVALDECAQVANLEEAWNAVIRPTLTDYKGDAWFGSTPRGMNFFWQLFTRGQDSAQTDYMALQLPTTANPFIDPLEVEDARKALPERVFHQEYLAEFIEDAGGVFRRVMDAVDRGRAKPEEPVGGKSYSMGVDLARVQDFTVLSVFTGGRQVYFERFNQISWERQREAINRVARRYGAHVWLDSTGVGDPIFEALRKDGLRVTGYTLTNSSKEDLINNAAMKIEQGDVRLMDIAEQTAEFLAYQYEMTPSRNVRMNAPEGMHDDTVIAGALGIWGDTRDTKWEAW